MQKKNQLKALVESMISQVGSGHYASSISALNIMYRLFYEHHIKPDQFILSKGHAAPALYAILYDLGYIESLDGFRTYEGLPGHPSIKTNGVLCSSGSLGMGISKALGLALLNPNKTYHVLVGDGELQEGQNWEALLYMEANKVGNVRVHVDWNEHQYSGKIRNRLEALRFRDENKNIMIHKTHWEHDNKYLTKPTLTDYRKRVNEYSNHLLNLMDDDRAIVLCADLVDDFGLEPIKEKYPNRFIDTGISEQHMVSMANGIARGGGYPICHTFGAFYRRVLDQIWNNYCDKLKIIYVAGLVGRHPINIGLSHKATRGRDLLNFMPDIQVTNRLSDLKIGSTIYYELEI